MALVVHTSQPSEDQAASCAVSHFLSTRDLSAYSTDAANDLGDSWVQGVYPSTPVCPRPVWQSVKNTLPAFPLALSRIWQRRVVQKRPDEEEKGLFSAESGRRLGRSTTLGSEDSRLLHSGSTGICLAPSGFRLAELGSGRLGKGRGQGRSKRTWGVLQKGP